MLYVTLTNFGCVGYSATAFSVRIVATKQSQNGYAFQPVSQRHLRNLMPVSQLTDKMNGYQHNAHLESLL